MADSRIRVGIFFGGKSREREVSFAGGRTVFDNLDKRIFEGIPVFVDHRGNFVQLNWENIYKGSIRDFFPPVDAIPESPNQFQVYSDSLILEEAAYRNMLQSIGKPLNMEDLPGIMDIAFLALHGAGGEDGSIQGLLDWLGIPYTGSGLLPSSLGMNKAVQKQFQSGAFPVPEFNVVSREMWMQNPQQVFDTLRHKPGFPMVIKPANQGSSIGVSVLKEADFSRFAQAMNLAFFKVELTREQWLSCDKIQWVRSMSDLRDGLGMPLLLNGSVIHHPEDLLQKLNDRLNDHDSVWLEGLHGETEVLAESFIEGREFSCIVISDENGKPIALPPTEIIKPGTYFDYKSKYLPGLSRKVTPIQASDADIERIRESCSKLYTYFRFDVYARIDGFFAQDGTIYLNDPNTTSGMMPSSFFFHQAAEIGLNPTQFLTYIIRNSLSARSLTGINSGHLLELLDQKLLQFHHQKDQRLRVAVVMGGYSTERHISLESGRNIYEKLSGSEKYQPVPVFLTGSDQAHELYILPVQMLLKDNADDIRYKIKNFSVAAAISGIIEECSEIHKKYAPGDKVFHPVKIEYPELKELCDFVFIALHGRPGEDGAIQEQLEKYHLAYNGSGIESSRLTINKYETNNLLRANGFLVADSLLVTRENLQESIQLTEQNIGFPLIAKPADEGCSSAVIKIKNTEMLRAYAALTFRNGEQKAPENLRTLGIQESDEFPSKPYFLIEKFIARNDAQHFLEITGGLYTDFDEKGEKRYVIFEASEALAEGEVLSLAEKFLAGEGQNITPARYDKDAKRSAEISAEVKKVFKRLAVLLNVEGYCRIDAFVRIYPEKTEVIIIEINSLPGMTPATCIYHQAALESMKPYDFIDQIIRYGIKRNNMSKIAQ